MNTGTNARSKKATYTHDKANRVKTKALHNDLVTTFTYDAAGNKLVVDTTTHSGMNVVDRLTYTYDKIGRKSRTRDVINASIPATDT